MMTKSKDRKVNVVKEFHTLLKNIASFSDGQAAVTKWEDDCVEEFEVTISPNDGLYKDGEFVFKIIAKEDYPSRPPRVLCRTAIYHPNIDTVEDPAGEVCLNLLDDEEWGEGCTLEDAVQGILFLFYNPNLDDPLSCHFNGGVTQEEYEVNVRISLAGGVIDDMYIYPGNVGYARKHPKIEDTEILDGHEECTDGDCDGKNKEEKRAGCHSSHGEGNEGESMMRKVEDCGGGDGEGKFGGESQDAREGVKACRTEQDENMEGEEKSTVQTANTSSSGQRIVDLHFGIRLIHDYTYDSDDEEEYDDDDIDGEEEEDDRWEDGCLVSADEEEEHGASSPSNSEEAFEECNDTGDVIDCDIEDVKDIVSDEELESIVNALDKNGSCNGLASSEKSWNSTEGCDSFVSWSNVVYGFRNRRCVDTAAAVPWCLVPDIIVADDSLNAVVPMATMTPTVLSRFYRSLQTRSFRQWLI